MARNQYFNQSNLLLTIVLLIFFYISRDITCKFIIILERLVSLFQFLSYKKYYPSFLNKSDILKSEFNKNLLF